MAEELLSLKWNNHQAHFVDILTFLREQEIFIDATLACGGKLYPAHKFVLSTCSDYFKQMFTKSPNKHPIVFMKDVACRDLEALLDFMYNGEVNVPQSSLGSLIKTAEGLQIKGLAVPDDPPLSKRDQSVLKDRRDQKLRIRDNSFSPPPKRLRERDRSPLLNSSASLYSNSTHNRTRSPHNPSSNNQTSCVPVTSAGSTLETALDDDSRTSAQSGVSEHSQNVNSKSNVNNQCSVNNEDTSHSDNQASAGEPSPGPSGLHRHGQSKEEELDIKQEEDVGLVDLDREDEDDWRDGEGMEAVDDGGGGDSSMSSANAQNFSDVMLPPTDGSLPSGDPAMGGGSLDEDLVNSILTNKTKPAPSDPPNFHSFLLSDQFLSYFAPPSSTSSGTSGESPKGDRLKSFYSQSSLNAFMRSNLALNSSLVLSRPFSCPYCNMTFKRKYTMQEHVRIHLGYRPYSCTNCGRTFTQSSSLWRHSKVCFKRRLSE